VDAKVAEDLEEEVSQFTGFGDPLTQENDMAFTVGV
jgi:hypothetical protein